MKTSRDNELTRRSLLRSSAIPALSVAILPNELAVQEQAPRAAAGIDRVTVLPGKTYLRGWAGYGDPPRRDPRRDETPAPVPTGPAIHVTWTKQSGPGPVAFADPKAPVTTASFKTPGLYTLKLEASNGASTVSSTVQVLVETPPPARQLDAVYPRTFKLDSPLWNARAKALIVNWIPHCIDQINRTDIKVGEGGIDNFIEAGKKLRGEPCGLHKGYVFSNAWVHQTVESMCIALMVDPQGDAEIIEAHKKMRATLDNWIPIILAAQEPDGYLQTAFTLDRAGRGGKVVESSKFKHWDPAHRGDHEGYVAGYFIESAINHYMMTGGKDLRLYNAAKKLCDCWCDNLGPAPKKPWYDGHQQMEQGLVRFGRFVNDMEGAGKGNRYIQLAKYLLDARYVSAPGERSRHSYDQSHLPVVEQYEAVGHAVRAVYTYSGMADVAVETHDPDYQSAVKSIWANLVHRKLYLTGGVGSGETSEGFGEDYSLPMDSYCEACSSCGEIFFQWKMHLAYHDASYVDLYEETLYNALLGSLSLEGKHFYYDNPLDERHPRYAWHVCPCCVGNIPRTLLMLPTWTYTKSADSIYVNLFAGSTIRIEGVAGTDVEIVQKTDYPWRGQVALTVNPRETRQFSLRIRVPNRNPSALYRSLPDVPAVNLYSVNGDPQLAKNERGYAVLTREWRAGDKVEFNVPLLPQLVFADDRIASTRGKVALRYGPLIYNIEAADQDISKSLPPDARLTTEWRQGLLGGITVIRSRFSDGSPLLAIPHFARMNRTPGRDYPAPQPRPDATGKRPEPPPLASIVWIKEGV